MLRKGKKIVGIILSIVLLFVATGCKVIPVPTTETDNLYAFSKIYGYVRYFHPSDEASTINWDKFLVYGIEKVRKAKNNRELKQILDSLFLPLTPTMKIYFENKKPDFTKEQQNKDTCVLVSWQHYGVGLGNNGTIYRSVRIGRLNLIDSLKAGIINYELPREIEGKKFKLSLKMYCEKENYGAAFLSYNLGWQEVLTEKVISTKKNEWEECVLIDTIPLKARGVGINVSLMRQGKILIDSVRLYIEKTDSSREKLNVFNENFDSLASDGSFEKWYTNNGTYKNVPELMNNHRVSKLEMKPNFIFGSLFENCIHDIVYVDKKLGFNLCCHMPISLYLSKARPTKFSAAFNQLNEQVNKITQDDLNNRENKNVVLASAIMAWNIFQHFYPYFDVVKTKTNWDNTLSTTLDKLLKDSTDGYMNLREMGARLYDAHGFILYPPFNKQKYLPYSIEWVEDKAIVVATKTPEIEIGDIITDMDGKPMEAIREEMDKYIPGSPRAKKKMSLTYIQRGDSDKIVKVGIENAKGEKTLEVGYKYEQVKKEGVSIKMLKDNIYYINTEKASWEEIKNELPNLSNAKGVIIDIRGYPNTNMRLILNHLTDKPILSAKWNKPCYVYPDQENLVKFDTSGRWDIKPNEPKLKGKIVFLTNYKAQSYAESILGIVEHYKLGEIIGSPTVGVNGNVNCFTTPGEFKYYFTGMKVLKHDNSQHHLIGILPTIPCEPTIKGIREGKDEVLDKAVEVILKDYNKIKISENR